MNKKKAVVALGHKALGITLPEQKIVAHEAAASIADLIEDGYQLVTIHELAALHQTELSGGNTYSEFHNAS